MGDAHQFLKDITLVLVVAAVTTVLFQKLRQPVVLGYLLAGAIISPNTPIPIVADMATVHTLSELGVILLMFSLGLEFSFRKLLKVGPRAAFVAVVQSSFMVWVGFAVGRAFGWSNLESLFVGGALAISSTTIIVKAFQERNVSGTFANLVFAILIVEDLIAIILLAILTPIGTGANISAAQLLTTVGRLVLFLLTILVVGYLTIPRFVRFVLKLNRPETTLVAAIGIGFGISYLAQAAGYSIALGAFMAGSLVAESGEEKHIEHLVQPVRDMFAAIFFVAIGMLLDPKMIAEHWLAIVVLTSVVILGKLIGVSVGAYLAGYGTRTSVSAGMSLAQIGEFSFIIAGVGLSLGAVSDFIYPVAVAVSAITTLTTPWLIAAAPRVATFVDRSLPGPIQTFTALYASWIDKLTSKSVEPTYGRNMRRLVLLLAVDAAFIVLIAFGSVTYMDSATELLRKSISLSNGATHAVIIVGAATLSLPFMLGILRCSRLIGAQTAAQIFAAGDQTAVVRHRTVRVAIQLAVLLMVGAPVLAITQPFLSSFQPALVFVAAIGVALIAMWKSAKDLDAEVRAGAQSVIDALEHALPSVANESLPKVSFDIGAPTPVLLKADNYAVGKSLRDLDLRGKTGAMVVALERNDKAVMPSPHEKLESGDVLALVGSRDAIGAADQLLKLGT
jgi:CPA2 family monovalent cation:H+ antiporter-2